MPYCSDARSSTSRVYSCRYGVRLSGKRSDNCSFLRYACFAFQLRVRPLELDVHVNEYKTPTIFITLRLRKDTLSSTLSLKFNELAVNKDDNFGFRQNSLATDFIFLGIWKTRGNPDAANPDDRKQSVSCNAAQCDLRSGNSTGRHYLPYRDCRSCKRAKAGINKMEVCQRHVYSWGISLAIYENGDAILPFEAARNARFIVAFV